VFIYTIFWNGAREPEIQRNYLKTVAHAGLAQYIQQYNEVTKHNEVTANARRSSKLATELRAEPTQRPEDQPRWLTYGTSTSVSVHRCNRVDQVKTADVRVERGSEELGRPADRGRW